MRVGVLALQGAFIEHIRILESLGADAFPEAKALLWESCSTILNL